MKNLFIVLAIVLTSCNNVMHEEGDKGTQDSLMTDTASNENKLNNIINENRDSEDSLKNIEQIEQQLKAEPK